MRGEREGVLLYSKCIAKQGSELGCRGLVFENLAGWLLTICSRDGDLSTSSSSSSFLSSNSSQMQSGEPMYSFNLNLTSTSHSNSNLNNQETMQLPQRLELGVSDAGIIGRRVSVVEGDRVVAEGIIGWN